MAVFVNIAASVFKVLKHTNKWIDTFASVWYFYSALFPFTSIYMSGHKYHIGYIRFILAEKWKGQEQEKNNK